MKAEEKTAKPVALSPRAIVSELDKHIIGQDAAKRAVAIALRNRARRSQVDPPLRDEITPKNILMIGPTGVGKTEIARRLARLADAPFIKVEATKFTEVGYVGRDVESIIRDLADSAVKQLHAQAMEQLRPRAKEQAEKRILDAILGPLPQPAPEEEDAESDEQADEDPAARGSHRRTRERFLQMLRNGSLDEREIEIELSSPILGLEIMAPPGMEEMTSQLQEMFQGMHAHAGRTRTRKLLVKEARGLIVDEVATEMINPDEIKTDAIERVEQHGIVFIDEIDKVVGRRDTSSADVSREGVQRDLLPLVEGLTVVTKYGAVKTDHILFIASGSFHLSKPSDLIPELQGRLPIRVELNALQVEDFIRILTEPDGALTRQYTALMATENFSLRFAENGIVRIAEVACEVNERLENIGARRLHTVMEYLLEKISFEASERSGETLEVDGEYVDQHLKGLLRDHDLTRYIL